MKFSDPVRILVTASRGDAAEEYLDALREAGAEPIPIEPGSATADALDGFDGLLVSGGADVDPALYGAPASPLIADVERERDDFESTLLRGARDRRLPTFCICRGLQIANVAFGGSLVADIPAAFGDGATIRHATADDDRDVLADHVVRIEPGSLLARTVRTLSLATNGRHHQAVERCAGELHVVGRTGDGVVEALEARFDSPFWLAVQWHPESTRASDGGASKTLFAAFTFAARDRRAGRTRRPSTLPTRAQWFASLSATEQARAEAMMAVLERLGDTDPLVAVRSEMTEDIPQTARRVAVRPLWDIIDGWRDRDTLARKIGDAQIDPSSCFADAWLAAHRMLAAGLSFDEVAAFARGVSYATIFDTLVHLDGGTLPAEWYEDDALPAFKIMEVRNDEPTGRELGCLYEDLLTADPSGREGRPPKL